MNDIGELLVYSVGLVVGDLACGTSHWAMGCQAEVILAVDSAGKDEDDMFFVIGDLGMLVVGEMGLPNYPVKGGDSEAGVVVRLSPS